ncbi:MAG: chorismate mutase [Bacteroidales bacterium]|jgi:chorismate mutase/mannose-6-phosphate isomerase-like protein (cupin superfamily)|nr:chorismate mutase [Bacteroidales bacterium]
MTKFNLNDKAKNTQLFEYVNIAMLNDHSLNLVAVENRSLDFHIHADSDEMFLVVEGEMEMEFRDRLEHLSVGDCIIVPRGTEHRPVCTALVKCLLIEKEGTLTNENTGGTYQKCNSLEDVRTQIDRIDTEIVRLIAERGSFVKQAATFKKDNNAVQAPQRVEAVIQKVRSQSETLGANADVVEKLYREMIAGFVKMELNEFEKRKKYEIEQADKEDLE